MNLFLRRNFLGISVLLMLGACSNSNTQDEAMKFTRSAPESVYINDKVALDLEEVSAESPHFKQVNRMEASAAESLKSANKEELVLPEGTQLLAVIDNNCAYQNEISETVRNSENAHNHLRRQAASISLRRGMSLSELTQAAAADPCVIEIANDGVMKASVVSNDTFVGRQLQLSSIQSPDANNILLASGALSKDVVIAVIDTGVQLNHPDLKANLWADSAGNAGFNYVGKNSIPNDDNGHGTHCAGLAAAVTNNAAGVAGVMPTRAKIMAIKALDANGAGSLANIINGIYFAIDNKADVISLSLGGNSPSSALRKALVDATNAGIAIFIAAGNSSANIATAPEYPAAYAKDIEGVMAVASIDSQTKRLSGFSNFSKDFVEIAAPGSNGILSTYLNGYAFLQGTSMATPIVAGAGLAIISWLKSHNYAVKASLVESILKSGSEVNANLANSVQGSRSLNMLTLASTLQANFADGKTAIVAEPVVAATPSPTPAVAITPVPTATPAPSPTPAERRCRFRFSFFCR